MKEVTSRFDARDEQGKSYQIERIQHFRQLSARCGEGEVVATHHEYRTSCGLHLQEAPDGRFWAWETRSFLRRTGRQQAVA